MAEKIEQDVAATGALGGRTVCAAQVVDIPEGATPSAWSPPTLAVGRALPPLDIQIAPEPARKTRASVAKETIRAAEPPPRSEPPPPPEPVIVAPISPDESLEQIAERRPIDVARVVRTLLARAEAEDERDDMPANRQKAAILILGLGSDLSSSVLKYLTDAEIEEVAQGIAELDTATAQQKKEVFDEVKACLVSGEYLLKGGVDFVHSMLQKALDPRKAQAMMERITDDEKSGFHLLRRIDPNQIVPFITKEHPQTIALILTQLSPAQAAGVLNGMPEEMQVDVIYRIARMENLAPKALRRLEETLAQNLQALLSGQITEIGGPKAVAEVLNRTGRSTEKSILQRLDKQDPELAEEVRNQMFTFDDIANLTDREIQMILREVDTKDLAVALKGASEELKNRIFSNMSERVGTMVKDQMQASGPVRMSDVEDIQLRVVQTVRQLEEKGQITVVRGDTDDVFV